MRPVTDKELLKKLENGEGKVFTSNNLRPVSDPNLLNQLELQDNREKIDSYNQSLFTPRLNTPSSALMQQGIEVGKNPIGRTAEEVFASIPFGLGGGAEFLLSRLAARNAPKALMKAADIGSMIGKNAAFGAGSSAINPDLQGNAQERSLSGALWGGGLSLPAKGIGEVINKLRPSQLFKSALSPQQLEENLRITKGTNTGLGDVLENPFLKKTLENNLTSIPGTGANEVLQEIYKQTSKKGENILSNLLGKNDNSDVPGKLHELLNKQYKKQEELKKALYTDANEVADKRGFEVKAPKFAASADRFKKAIENSNISNDSRISELFERIKNYDNPSISGKPYFGKDAVVHYENEPASLKNSNLLAHELKKMANIYSVSADSEKRGLAKIFNKLSSSLKSDIKNSISNFGDEQLENEYLAAEKNYKNNFSKFLDKDIYKFIGGNADPDTIVQKFIQTSPSKDMARQMSKLSTTLKFPEDKKLLAYSYFSRAIDNEDKLNPSKLGTLIRNLGKNQFKELIPDDNLRKELKNFSKLSKMNQEAQYLMVNPKTGARNLPILIHGLSGLTGAVLGGKEQGTQGSVAGGLAGLVAPSLIGRYATKALTSESLREELVKKMLENKGLPGGNMGMGLLQALQQRLMEKDNNGT